MWTLPAVQLADGALARELLLRMCELHGYAPGRGVHYLDGTLFEPGFSLEGAQEVVDLPGETVATIWYWTPLDGSGGARSWPSSPR